MTQRQWYNILYCITRPFIGLFYPMKFYGKENIPEGGALLCANHSAAIDPFFVAFALGRKHHISPMAKESLLNTFFIGKIIKLIGGFGVKRGASDLAAYKYAVTCLKEGKYVLIFPEGTRISCRSEGEPKTGAAMMAVQAKATVVPIYVPFKKRPFRINRVYIGKPYRMEPEGKRVKKEEFERFTNDLMDRIYDCGDGK